MITKPKITFHNNPVAHRALVIHGANSLICMPPFPTHSYISSSTNFFIICSPPFSGGCPKPLHYHTPPRLHTIVMNLYVLNIHLQLQILITQILQVSILKLQMLLEEYKQVPWAALIYLTSEVIYGGRVTDDWDQRCLKSLLVKFYSPTIFEPGFCYDSSHVSAVFTLIN